MNTARIRRCFLVLGICCVSLAAALAVNRVLAGVRAQPNEQASPLHPTFALLDAKGQNVLEDNTPVSTMQTCGQCHDTSFIASHSFHSDLGFSEQSPPGMLNRPWDTSPGLYGKWNPLTYRYLSPQGDRVVDLDQASWVAFNAGRLVGGGPAEALGLEMNCFLCHLTQPANAARVEAIQSGQVEWAATATLMEAGIVERSGEGFLWNPAAFTDQGELNAPFVAIQDPNNANCAQCHGVVQVNSEQALTLVGCDLDQWQTATTGQVISGERISLSGVNLTQKASRTHPWDIHAARGLECTDCHFSLNNPAYYLASEESRPAHLQFDPRRLEIGEYLQRPDHNFARGQSAQYTIAESLKGTMRRCESCHDASLHADWLPYVERHMEELACESCHIPELAAPAIQFTDWTALQLSGQPLSACRGVEGETQTITDLVTGFQPVLLQRRSADGDLSLAPYNLIASWYWLYDSPEGPRPVLISDLRAAWFENDRYAADVLALFDVDGDGALSAVELRLDTLEKERLIAGRLRELGLANPRIQAEIQPYSINHNVVTGSAALKDCQACHADQSRLAAPMQLAAYLPGGMLPVFVADANVQAGEGLAVKDGALVYSPNAADHGLYVFGHHRVDWIDWLGALFFAGVLLGVAGHGGLRFYNTLRRPRRAATTRPVYMYSIYERFWHWLQTTAIVLLLFTGLVIHRPDIFGWLSFRYMVTLHNVLAVVLVVNAALSLFYHLASGEIQQFIPRPYGFFDQAFLQAKYYLQGIFTGRPHPFEKSPQRKMNPLQQATYFGILNVLLPLQIITGALMWGVQRWPTIAGMLGGLPFLAPFHSLVAWTFAAFIVGHVYLTTTVGHEPLAGIQAMIHGWEDMEEEHAQYEEQPAVGQQAPDDQASPASTSASPHQAQASPAD
jgi:thiosulfate reductase cytochrome b subunit